jgi:DNA-binding CsgD family transcriptional regulator
MSPILQHPAFLYSQDLKDICQPLATLGITYFGHGRIDQHKNFSAINNHAEFLEQYFKKHYYTADIHMSDTIQANEMIVWDAMQSNGKSAEMGKDAFIFGIHHTFTLVEKNYYHFATNKHSSCMNEFYLANIDLLKLFIRHFNEQVNQSKELTKSYAIKFSLKKNNSHYLIKSDHDYINWQQKRSVFINKINTHKNSILLSKQSMPFKEKLSKREIDCLLLTIQGQTAKQVANRLQLSNRTVEEYLNKTKAKFGVHSKAELIEKAINEILLK